MISGSLAPESSLKDEMTYYKVTHSYYVIYIYILMLILFPHVEKHSLLYINPFSCQSISFVLSHLQQPPLPVSLLQPNSQFHHCITTIWRLPALLLLKLLFLSLTWLPTCPKPQTFSTPHPTGLSTMYLIGFNGAQTHHLHSLLPQCCSLPLSGIPFPPIPSTTDNFFLNSR